MKKFGEFSELTRLLFAGSTSGITEVKSTAVAGTSVLTLPVSVGDTLVAQDVTQEIKNKTINRSLNTITNLAIVNTDIDNAAAINRSKLASGSNNYVVINSGAGAMTEEQYLDRTRGGTGITSTATFPSSGVIVTRAATEELSNKSFTSVLTLKAANEVRFNNAGDTKYMGLRAGTVTDDRVLILPDGVGSNGQVLTTDGNTGGAQLSWSTALINPSASAITIEPTSNQLVLGTTRTITITAPTPASSSRVLTIPDPGADAEFVLTSGASQTISGAKVFSSSVALSGSVNVAASSNQTIDVSGKTKIYCPTGVTGSIDNLLNGVVGQMVWLLVTGGTGNCTVNHSLGNILCPGETNLVISGYGGCCLVCTGTIWYVCAIGNA